MHMPIKLTIIKPKPQEKKQAKQAHFFLGMMVYLHDSSSIRGAIEMYIHKKI